MLSALFHNYVLICSLLGWTIAQLIKTVRASLHDGKINYERMFGAGGMPSGHSATVTALVVSTLRRCGAASPELAIAVVVAAVVIYDAMGVRRAAGEQAKVINRIVDINNTDDDDSNDIESDRLKESLGHTPLEVLGGIALGIVIPFVIPMH